MSMLKKYLYLLTVIVMSAGLNAAHANTDKEKIAAVNTMIHAWNVLDADKIADLFTEDGILHSMMSEPVVGRETLRAYLKKFLAGAERLELQVSSIGVVDGKVFVERVDDFHYKGKHGRVPVVGVFEIENGKVKEWREYYDKASLLKEMGIDVPASAGHP